jgi:hypothetical protein
MSTIQEIVINKDGLDLLFVPGQIGKSEDMRDHICESIWHEIVNIYLSTMFFLSRRFDFIQIF